VKERHGTGLKTRRHKRHRKIEDAGLKAAALQSEGKMAA